MDNTHPIIKLDKEQTLSFPDVSSNCEPSVVIKMTSKINMGWSLHSFQRRLIKSPYSKTRQFSSLQFVEDYLGILKTVIPKYNFAAPKSKLPTVENNPVNLNLPFKGECVSRIIHRRLFLTVRARLPNNQNGTHRDHAENA